MREQPREIPMLDLVRAIPSPPAPLPEAGRGEGSQKLAYKNLGVRDRCGARGQSACVFYLSRILETFFWPLRCAS
jgi:hypothetical protein